jgi:hypothetical protein
MQPLFSEALVACIRDGRAPRADEIASMAEKLRVESIASGYLNLRDAALLAQVALTGSRSMVQAGPLLKAA